MAQLQIFNIFRKKRSLVIKTKTNNIQLSAKEFKRKENIKKQELDKIKLEILMEKKKLMLFHNESMVKRLSTYCSFLAQEILITETFVSRIKKETNRDIVIIGNGGTGKAYTWSIKKDDKLHIEHFNYPSTRSHLTSDTFNNFKNNIINKYKSKNPIYIIVDASKSNRMPSSLVGFNKDNRYTQTKESLNAKLTKIKLKTAIVGYDWSMKNGLKYLPHLNEINNGKVDVILFNPLKDRGSFTINNNNWIGAYHDDYDVMKNNFKELTLLYRNMYKHKYINE